MLKKICSAVLVIVMLVSMTTAVFGKIYYIDNFDEDTFSAKKLVLADGYIFAAGGTKLGAVDKLNIYDTATRELVTSLALPIYTTGKDYFVENMHVVDDYMYISWNKNGGSGDPPIRKYKIDSLISGQLEHVSSVGVRGDHVSCLYDNKLFFTDPVFKTLSIIDTDTDERTVVMNFASLTSIADIIGVCADENYFYIVRSNEIMAFDASDVYGGNMQDYDSPYATYKSQAVINQVKLSGGNIYVATEQGLDILNIGDATMTKTGSYTGGGEVKAVTFAGDSAYIYAHATKSIDVLDITSSAKPELLDSAEVSNTQTSGIADLIVNGGRIYAADLTDGVSFYSNNELDRMEQEEEFKATSYTEELAMSRHGDAIELVVGLRIMKLRENGMFGPNLYITRGEFAEAISNLLGATRNGTLTTMEFTDVPKDHPNAEGIYALTNLGIINGTGDGRFLPNDAIMYEHAVKIMIKLLGYYPLKEYGDTCMSIATNLRILDNVAAMNGGLLSRGDAARLIYNSLETKRLEIVSYADPDNRYRISKENTLLAQMGIVMEEGQVTATEFTSLLGKRQAGDGKVIIDGVEYPEGESGASGYLGRYITFYHKSDDTKENGEILFIVPSSGEDIITVNAENISSSTSETTFSYFDENDKAKSEDIRNATVILNGKYFAGYKAADLIPQEGEVTLIDSDRNGSTDVVVVRSYETFVVDAFADNIFKFKYGFGELNIKNDISQTDKIIVEVDGTRYDPEGKISGVKEWSVVSLLRSKDRRIIEVYVTNMVASGMVTSLVTGSDAGSVAALDDVEYVLSQTYLDNVANPLVDIPEIATGGEVFAYIDMFGKIATISRNELSTQYGYLIDCAAGKGLNSHIAGFKVLVRDQNEIHGSIKYFESADKLWINGNKVTDVTTVPEFRTVTGFNDQIIKFTLNSEGKIKEIFTAVNKVDEKINGNEDNPYYEENYVGYTEGEFTYDWYASKSTAFRGGDMMTFEGYKFLPTIHTAIFVVPDIDDPRDEDYKMYDNVNIFKSSSYPPGDVYAYDVDDEFNIGAIVVRTGGSVSVDDVGSSGKYTIIDSFRKGLDEEGEEKTILVSAKDINGNQEIIYLENADIEDTLGTCNESYKGKKLTDLPKGSIIQYVTNMRGEIIAIRILYIPTKDKVYFEYGDPRVSENYLALIFYCGFGKVIKVTESGRVLYNAGGMEINGSIDTANRKWDRNVAAVIQKPSIYLYDKETDEITTITLSDILPDDDIFIVRKSVYTNMIVIYR